MCLIEQGQKKILQTGVVNDINSNYLFANLHFSILLLYVYISLLTKQICKTQENKKKLELHIEICEFYLLL